MVRKIGQLLLNGEGGGGVSHCHPSTIPLSNFRSDLKNFSINRCQLTAKNLIWNKSSSHSREKLEIPVAYWRVNA